MTDVHADYVTVDELKSFLNVTSSDRDEQYASLVREASRVLDRVTHRRFYLPTDDETKVYDIPDGSVLLFNDYLWSVTTVTNGDGTIITNSQYWLWPANSYPKMSIELKPSQGIVWLPNSSGDYKQVIQIAGQWGFMAEPDHTVKLAVKQLVSSLIVRQGNQGIRTKRIGEYLVTFQKMQRTDDLPADVQMVLGSLLEHVIA